MKEKTSFQGARVAIVGGGQSGAEIFHRLITEKTNRPQKITWFSKRLNFLPLD